MSRDILYEVKGLVPDTVFINIREKLMISEDMDTEVDRSASEYGYWAVLSEKADTRYQRIKFQFETWKAEIESRETLRRSDEGKKKLTEAEMKSFVMSQVKYRAYMDTIIKFDEHKRILKVIAKAFELRKDMVQTKSSNRRIESSRVSGGAK
jgi:hypothetical protein